MKDVDIYKTAFHNQQGIFECLAMLFRVVNVQATFQHLMNTIFKDEPNIFISIYLDDILVISKIEEHLQYVHIALEKLRKPSCLYDFINASFLNLM